MKRKVNNKRIVKKVWLEMVKWGIILLLLAACGSASEPTASIVEATVIVEAQVERELPAEEQEPQATVVTVIETTVVKKEVEVELEVASGSGFDAEAEASSSAPRTDTLAGAATAADESASAEGEEMAEAEAASTEEEEMAETEAASAEEEEMAEAEAESAPEEGRSEQYETVTAGMVDDNEQWSTYLDYRERASGLHVKVRDVSERYILQVIDHLERPVHDAQVEIIADSRRLFEGRTDAGGRLLFHPRALSEPTDSEQFTVIATKGDVSQEDTFTRDEEGTQWLINLPNAPIARRAQLDILFLIDATGSMGDEIDKLKATMDDIASEIATLPQEPDLRYALVAYRDHDDEFITQVNDFTAELSEFQTWLGKLDADGGGDDPEALNQALHESLTQLTWLAGDSVRLILLVADAPPHLDYNEPFSYESDMFEAVRRGIKIFPIGASGLDAGGEYIFRQLAQVTYGKFVFLTYAQAENPSSGSGGETTHDVANYSVDTLDRLVVRLVQEELAKLPSAE